MGSLGSATDRTGVWRGPSLPADRGVSKSTCPDPRDSARRCLDIRTFGLGPQVFPGFLAQNLGDGDSRIYDLLAHQIGHALGLPDVPANEVDPRSFGEGSPEGEAIVWHDGIESAVEFPEEWFLPSSKGGPPTSPIMHPPDTDGSLTILRHHYLQIQEMIEDTRYFDP